MNRQRPTVVLVMAILNFVFGGLGLFGVVCGGLALLVLVSLAKNAPPPPQRDNHPDRPPRKRDPQEVFPPDVIVEQDDSDAGGPIKVKTPKD